MFPLNSQAAETLSSTNISTCRRSDVNSSSSIPAQSDVLLEINELRSKQTALEERIKQILSYGGADDTIKHDSKRSQLLSLPADNLALFRRFLWNFCTDAYNWKGLARSLHHLGQSIDHLDNYQIRETVQAPFKLVLEEFTSFIKYLITLQIRAQIPTANTSESMPTNFSDTPERTSSNLEEQSHIDGHIETLKRHTISLKESLSTVADRFHLCQTDANALQTLLQAIDQIDFDSKYFDEEDANKIHLLRLKQDLRQKSSKTDLIQFKSYIDSEVKRLIQLNKQNARELERIKLIKTATCQARQMQTLLSIGSPPSSPSSNNRPGRMCSYQSSRPYITFELDHIRQYQRQALVQSPYGTIPLYRRQAWAAANLFHGHPLHYLRYLQNSLRMQVHHLLGYDPSDIYRTHPKKKKKNNELFHTTQDISIVGDNNRLYRGRIQSCEVVPLITSKGKKSLAKTTGDEKNGHVKVNFDQINTTISDQHLFEHLDWQSHFNEQDLPDELCEELFLHWQSVRCEDPPCDCDVELKCEEKDDLREIQLQPSISNHSYDNRCICSDCSCECEKYPADEEPSDSIKQVASNDSSNYSIHDLLMDQESDVIPSERTVVAEERQEELIISDCFLNQNDRWARQFELFTDTHPVSRLGEDSNISHSASRELATYTHSSELDDPSAFRRELLDCHRQRERNDKKHSN